MPSISTDPVGEFEPVSVVITCVFAVRFTVPPYTCMYTVIQYYGVVTAGGHEILRLTGRHYIQCIVAWVVVTRDKARDLNCLPVTPGKNAISFLFLYNCALHSLFFS